MENEARLIEEIWKDVYGYEGYYQVSNMGRVRSLDRYIYHNGARNESKMIFIKGKELKPHDAGRKHLTVCLMKNGIGNIYYIHRLVMETFTENIDNLPRINHKDENPYNNELSNLEWCTHKYNTNYGSCIKKRSEKICKSVSRYDNNMNYIDTFNSCSQAGKELNIDSSSIAKCARGERNTAGGYIWKYD